MKKRQHNFQDRIYCKKKDTHINFRSIEIDPILQDIIPAFIENTIKDYEDLKAQLANQDYVQVGRICHRILGSAKSYGFLDLDEIVNNLQKEAIAQNTEAIELVFDMMSKYIEFIKVEFKQDK